MAHKLMRRLAVRGLGPKKRVPQPRKAHRMTTGRALTFPKVTYFWPTLQPLNLEEVDKVQQWSGQRGEWGTAHVAADPPPSPPIITEVVEAALRKRSGREACPVSGGAI